MSFVRFHHRPKNVLEEGGREAASLSQDENEPEKACPNCRKQISATGLWAHCNCCEHCGHHFRVSARQRIRLLTDQNSFSELDAELRSEDYLRFPGYEQKLELTRRMSGETEAVLCGTAAIKGRACCLFVMEPGFMMGSMGTAVGEKITRLFELAIKQRMPVVGFTVSGGARMQEGLLSLMQMAKTAAAAKRHSDAGLLYITVLTDPTTGGVTASFAMLGDIILSEPKATIGFAGARVIEQAAKRKLPRGFQTSEFLLEHGFADALAPRGAQRELLAELLKMHEGGGNLGGTGV